MATLRAEEFETLADFIYAKTGMRFEHKKKYFLSKRIKLRMDELGIDDVSKYVYKLKYGDPTGLEFSNLTDLLTVNETYFFRDFPQLQAFAEHCLEDLCDRKATVGDYKLRIWSAPCSSGEEPYTLGIILMEMLDNYRHWDIQIVAHDIDRQILNKARKGEYGQRSIKYVPASYLKNHFTEINENGKLQYRISEKIRKMVTFENINLSDRNAIQSHVGFDFIFCRNLLIYFDDISRKNLVDQFYLSLKSGGYLFLGSSESVGRISTAFRLKKANGYLVYYK